MAAVLAVLAVTAGCTGRTTAGTGRPAAAPCSPATSAPTGSTGGAASVDQQGSATCATLWALFFADPSHLHPGAQIKIAWRMTGAGAVTFVATGPGRTIRPVWGPEPHGGSSWGRPGDEWGTGWTFPVPGTWTIRVTRAERGAGQLTVHVS